MMPHRNVELDVLRGCAIILVLINHLSVAFVSPPTWLSLLPINGCSIGVALFFAVSGYVITITLRPCRDGIIDWRSFYIKRLFRIVPLAVIWIQATLIGTLLFNFHGFFGEWATNSRAASWVFMMVGNIGMNTEIGGLGALGVYWSLSVEEQFYVIVPLVMFLPPRLVSIAIVLVLMNAVLLVSGPVAKNFYQFTPLLMGSLIGIALPRLRSTKSLACADRYGSLCWVALLALPFGADAAMISYRMYWWVYLLCTLIVVGAGVGRGFLLTPAPISKALQYVGTRSYGIYLSHFTTSMFLREGWKFAIDRGLISGGPATQVAMLVSWLVATFAVTEFLHRRVELPMIAYGRRASDTLRADRIVARRVAPIVVELQPIALTSMR